MVNELVILQRLIPARAGKTLSVPFVETIHRAHPRSRGENSRRLSSVDAPPGSSPLARGKRPGESEARTWERLIPARAGKTPSIASSERTLPAHPRSRGENVFGTLDGGVDAGSSPLARGKPFVISAFVTRIGQILETLEPSFSSGSYSLRGVCATDAPLDQVRSIVRVLPSSRDAS